MGENSSIQWTHHTFNPWIGCTKVSPGCANCYAETQRKRFGKDEWGPGKPRTLTSAANWRKPLAWDRAAAAAGERHRVFCASLADWLDPEVPVDWLAALLDLIAETPNLDWLLLSKRPENWFHRVDLAGIHASESGLKLSWDWLRGTAPSNVWVGTTVEDQRRADERIPHLLSIPARVRFLSCEPLLEAVNLERIDCDGRSLHSDWCQINPLTGRQTDMGRPCRDVPHIDWIIVGGESGAKARPFDIAWARSILRQCKEAGVACFIKQWGSNATDGGQRLSLTDRKGGDPSEWGAGNWPREFPQV